MACLLQPSAQDEHRPPLLQLRDEELQGDRVLAGGEDVLDRGVLMHQPQPQQQRKREGRSPGATSLHGVPKGDVDGGVAWDEEVAW